MNIRVLTYFLIAFILVVLIGVEVIKVLPTTCADPIAGAGSQMVSIENGLEHAEITFLCP